MADSWMPDVQVDIAFTSTFATPAASRTWTDVSAYVELSDGIDIIFGRQDERSTADANQLTLTLDNTDGRFTAGRAASPYFPNVKIGRPIRVRVTPPGGSVVTRFVGFIDEWPVEWEGSDKYAKATVRASSRLSRLGLTAKMRSMPETAILTDRPVNYWTLGDPAGSSFASPSSGSATLTPVLNTGGVAVVFGNATGVPTDSLTAVETFTGFGDSLQTGSILIPAGVRSMRCWFRFVSGPDLGIRGLIVSSSDMSLFVSPAGLLQGFVSGTFLTGPNVADGVGRDLALVWNGANAILYVNGVQVDSVSTSSPVAATAAGLGAGNMSAVTSHFALYDFALSATQVAAHAVVMSAASAAERTDQRALRLLGWAGIPPTEVTTETGVETMTYQQTSGQSVVDALREVEATEGGVLFDDRDGNVRFHNRSHRYLSSAVATLNMAAQHVGADYSPKLDRSTLVNDVEASNPTTGEKARATSTASSDEYGIATATATSVASTYDPLQQKAAWLIASYATPRTRVPSLTVDILAHQGLTPSAQTLLGVTVGDLLAVTNAPTQADTTSPSYFVEGYTETIGPESYEVSFNLSPTYPTLNTFVLDDATRGVLDSGYVLAL